QLNRVHFETDQRSIQVEHQASDQVAGPPPASQILSLANRMSTATPAMPIATASMASACSVSVSVIRGRREDSIGFGDSYRGDLNICRASCCPSEFERRDIYRHRMCSSPPRLDETMKRGKRGFDRKGMRPPLSA